MASKKDTKEKKPDLGQKAARPGKAETGKADQPAKKALVLSYRRGRHTQTMNQMLLEIRGIDTKAGASRYIGRRVVWKSPGKMKKELFGKITAAHGNSGVLRARFSKGLPGTSVGTDVDILDKPKK